MSILTAIFACIELALRLFGLWGTFLDYINTRQSADAANKTAARNEAVDQSTKAKTDDEIWQTQDGVINNKP